MMKKKNARSWRSFAELLRDVDTEIASKPRNAAAVAALRWGAIASLGMSAVVALVGAAAHAALGVASLDEGRRAAERIDRARRKFDELAAIRDGEDPEAQEIANRALDRLFDDLVRGNDIVL